MKIIKRYEEDGYTITEYDTGHIVKEIIGIRSRKNRYSRKRCSCPILKLQYWTPPSTQNTLSAWQIWEYKLLQNLSKRR